MLQDNSEGRHNCSATQEITFTVGENSHMLLTLGNKARWRVITSKKVQFHTVHELQLLKESYTMKDLEVCPVYYTFFATETHTQPEMFRGFLQYL
jgi:hypothetical protein